MALPDLTGLNIEDTYQRVLHTDGTNIYDGTGSIVNVVNTGSFATTGSNTFYGTQTINGNLDIAGTASIAFLNVAIESASIIYSSGSNQLGDAANDTQTLYGNVIVPTGSLTVTGNISASGDLFVGSTNQVHIGDDLNETIAPGKLKLYTSGVDGFLTTYQYNSILDLKAGVSGSGFANSFSRIRLQDNFGSSGSIGFHVSGSERMRISNIGNVGIGTTSPRTTTEIVGTLRITNTSNSSRFNDLATDANGYISLQSLVYQSGIGSNSGYVNLFPNYINVGSGSGYFFTSTANSGAGTRDVGFSRAGINLVSVNTGVEGNANGSLVALNLGAGIGLTAPSARLQVKGSGVTSATTALRVENTNASASLVVLDDGNVGIGTSTPNTTLDIVGSVNISSSGTQTPFQIYSGNNPILKVSGSGKISIGSATNAGYALEVYDTGIYYAGLGQQAQLLITTSGSVNKEGAFIAAGSGRTLQMGIYDNAVVPVGIDMFEENNNSPSTYLNFRVNNANLVRMTGSFVGIGTTSPTASLHISGAAAEVLLEIDSPSVNNILYVSGSGRIGVGTNTPTHRLTVQGTTLIDSSVSAQGSFNLNPVTAPGAIGGFTLATGSSLGVGTYYYFAAYVTALGETNAGSVLLVTTTTGTTTVNLTGIPTSSDPRVTARKLYRTKLGGTSDNEWFLATISDNTTTTYTDTIADASLTGVGLQGYKINTTSRYITTNGTQGMILDGNLTTLGLNAGAAIISTNASSVRSVFIGNGAGQSVTTGAGNTLVGGLAGGFLTTGASNTLIGDLAGYVISNASNNVVIGAQTARYLTTGGSNIIIGTSAASLLTDGTTQFTQGTNNTIVGPSIRMSTITDTNSIVIGSTAWGLGSNTAVLGNDSITRTALKGNVSIGTTGSISARLQVRGSGATSATTNFLLQNSTPTNLMTVLDNGQFAFSSPVISLANTQSAFWISQSISQSAVIGAQVYGVNITPTFFATTASQTETAFRVAATFTGSAAATGGTNIIADLGATSVGSQFTVTDVTSGSIYMVNDVSGLPIIEATSDWTVIMYNFPNKVFEKRGNNVNIYGTLNATGSFILPLSQSASPQTGSAYWSGSFLFVYDGTRYRSSSFA